VKTSIVHTLHRVKALGALPLETLKEMLSEEDYKKCATSPHILKTWFKMTTDVFISFLFRVGPKSLQQILHCEVFCLATMFESMQMLIALCLLQQEIAEAADEAARKYYDETEPNDRSDTDVTALMRAAAKSKQQSFRGQFAKHLAVANPKFGDKFLQEVSAS
jgi:hypothetical protein